MKMKEKICENQLHKLTDGKLGSTSILTEELGFIHDKSQSSQNGFSGISISEMEARNHTRWNSLFHSDSESFINNSSSVIAPISIALSSALCPPPS